MIRSDLTLALWFFSAAMVWSKGWQLLGWPWTVHAMLHLSKPIRTAALLITWHLKRLAWHIITSLVKFIFSIYQRLCYCSSVQCVWSVYIVESSSCSRGFFGLFDISASVFCRFLNYWSSRRVVTHWQVKVTVRMSLRKSWQILSQEEVFSLLGAMWIDDSTSTILHCGLVESWVILRLVDLIIETWAGSVVFSFVVHLCRCDLNL